MSHVVVVANEITDHYHHDGQRYGSWESSHSYRIDRVCLQNEQSDEHFGFGEYFDIAIPVELQRGDPVYVLVMRYSSGDSFGHSTGNGEVLWAFADARVAFKAKDTFLKDENRDSYSVNITLEDGSEIPVGNPAYGYFENIENIEVHTLTLQ